MPHSKQSMHHTHCPDFMLQRPSWQACSEAAVQRTSHLLCSLKANYCVHKTYHWIRAVSWNQSILIHSVYFMIPFNIILPTNPMSLNWPLPLGFSKILYEFLISTMPIQDPPCPLSTILLPQQYLVNSSNYNTPHYGVFSVLLLLLFLKSTCSPQHLILHHIRLHSSLRDT